ncbi:MAG: hypothetical protein MUO72_06445 [Bacteroidales bacterium]|nr:hypothetical protein [Bacteroidales bacterium]
MIIILQIFFTSCEKDQKETPDCIFDLIETHSYCTKGWSVDQYSFQNQNVYVITPPLLGNDIASSVYSVYNENCEMIGTLGGIAGINIINNELFYGHAIFQKAICPTDSI